MHKPDILILKAVMTYSGSGQRVLNIKYLNNSELLGEKIFNVNA